MTYKWIGNDWKMISNDHFDIIMICYSAWERSVSVLSSKKCHCLRTHDTVIETLMHAHVCSFIYAVIATTLTVVFACQAPVLRSTCWQRYTFRLIFDSVLSATYFMQIRLAFLSSVTNEPMCETATKPRYAVGSWTETARKSMLAHWFINTIRRTASYGNVTFARYCDTLAVR